MLHGTKKFSCLRSKGAPPTLLDIMNVFSSMEGFQGIDEDTETLTILFGEKALTNMSHSPEDPKYIDMHYEPTPPIGRGGVASRTHERLK
jgi:hypothetical protein